MLEDSRVFLIEAKTYEEFSLWGTRSLFLIEEVVEQSLRTLDLLINGETIRNHDLDNLAERTGTNMGTLSFHLQGLALKLKYPACYDIQQLGASIIDQLEALCYSHLLDGGGKIVGSARIPSWNIPISNVSRTDIIINLNILLSDMKATIKSEILSKIEKFFIN